MEITGSNPVEGTLNNKEQTQIELIHQESGQRPLDIIFVGGGLANGLAAYRFSHYRPDLSLALIESTETLGGNHTWSFHQGDLTTRQRAWVAPFITKSWMGYDVRFPELNRTVYSEYFSVQSTQFHRVVKEQVGNAVLLNTSVRNVKPDHVVLDNDKVFRAKCVIDGRGWVPEARVPVGYQKFLGLVVHLNRPHGLHRPVLMDACVPQKDGYRFFYLLPWTDRSLLVEDTRYSDSPDLDKKAIKKEILIYIKSQGWSVASLEREEDGVLPIPLDGKVSLWEEGVPLSGTRAGLFHSTTGYSFPQAVRFAEGLAELSQYDGSFVYDWAKEYAHQHWQKEGFFRLLNRLLFRASEPEQRFRVLQKFYRFPDGFISRFYAGTIKRLDQVRVFTGTPPVPITKAIQCLFNK